MVCLYSECKDLPFTVLWDVDGTKVDSEPVHEIRWERVARAYGVILKPEMFDQSQTFSIPDDRGRSKQICRPLRGAHEDVICYWIIHQMRMQGGRTFPKLPDMKRELFEEYRKNQCLIKPRQGITSLMERLRAEGDYQIAVTGCHRDIAEINLLAMNGTPLRCIEFAITADHTQQHKPMPDPYLYAFRAAAVLFSRLCNRINITPEQVAQKSVIIEDSPSGVESGLRAGVPVIQFLNPGQKPFPAHEKGFDPKLLHIAETASDIYKHRSTIRASNKHKSCRIRRNGCGFFYKGNVSNLFLEYANK